MKNKLNQKIIIIFVIVLLAVGVIFERVKNENQAPKDGNNKKLEELVGKPSPNFSLTDLNGNIITKESLKGKRAVLFFNEGLACYPACWDQMKQLTTDERFKGDNIIAYSVVVDSKRSWINAIEKKSDLGGIDVIFDEEKKVSEAFGADNTKSAMHQGIPGHTYVILDNDSIVRYVLDDPKMAINNDLIYNEISKLK